jgi:hypothetical protein
MDLTSTHCRPFVVAAAAGEFQEFAGRTSCERCRNGTSSNALRQARLWFDFRVTRRSVGLFV